MKITITPLKVVEFFFVLFPKQTVFKFILELMPEILNKIKQTI